jgi:peptidoglycan/LPS O-acetylase OafA/YrhL
MPRVIETAPAQSGSDPRAAYRRDIDGLRAIAVLPVVAFHFFPGLVRGGFVGVDIFFVISGYLISGIIFRGVEQGRFRFGDFYARRVRRIFPALLLVLCGCLLFGWVAMLADEYGRLGKHVAGGAAFVSNWISWAEAGYFDSAAELKPLLHLWSLGIEEQFYLIWPPLVLLTARHRLGVPLLILGLLVVPFCLNLWKVHGDSETAFYLPFTRFWELMVGGTLAWLSAPPSIRPGALLHRLREVVRSGIGGARRTAVGAVGLLLIAASIALLDKHRAFPGWWAILPTAGAFLVIAAGEAAWPNRIILANPITVWVGLISYPLYLWHWPLLSFARIMSPELPSRRLKLALAAVSIVLAWLTYRLIELPIRSGRRTRTLPLGLAGAVGIVGLVGLFLHIRGGVPSRFPAFSNQLAQLDWPYWKNEACERRFPFKKVHGWWFCMLSADVPPRIVMLGSSHANHLYPGLVGEKEFGGQGVLDIGACDPVDGITFRTSDTETAAPCRDGHNLEANAFIQSRIAATPSLRFAILSSNWPSFRADGSTVPSGDGLRWEVVSTDEHDSKLPASEQYFAALSRFVSFLESRRLRVILAYDTPSLPYEARDCLDIRPFPKRQKKDCTVSATAERARQASFRQLAMRLVADHPQVAIFDPLPVFCDGVSCRLVRGEQVLLRDQNHLSVTGSHLYANAFLAWARGHVPDIVGAGSPVAEKPSL